LLHEKQVLIERIKSPVGSPAIIDEETKGGSPPSKKSRLRSELLGDSHDSTAVAGLVVDGHIPHIAADYFTDGYHPQARRSNSFQGDRVVTSTTYRQAKIMAGKLESTSDGEKSDTHTKLKVTESPQLGQSISHVVAHQKESI
jgi:hypothetical protein